MTWDNGWVLTVQKRKYCCDQSNPSESWSKCEWRNDIGGFGTKGKRCKSGCASNQVRVAMQGWEDCYESGAKSYCCQGTYRTEYEVLLPELQAFEKAMSAWEDNPVCFNDDGGLLTGSNTVAKRKQIPFVFRAAAKAEILLSDLIIGYETNSTGEMFETKKYIFNKHIEPTWKYLNTSYLLPWITSEEAYPSSELYSPQKRAHLVLCYPDAFNNMVSDSPTLDCGHYQLGPSDYLPADGSTDGPVIPQNSRHGLEKRDGAQAMIFGCKGKSGRRRTIKYQRQPYPSINEWDDNEPQVRNSYDLSDWDHCHTTEIQTHNLQNQPRGDYDTEHVVELQTIETFMQWAIKNEEECLDIDCDFFADFFNEKVLGDDTPNIPGLDVSHQRVPMQRVMEMLGSDYNRENFAILYGTINLNKAQLWRYGRPRKDETWGEKKLEPTTGLQLIRDTIAVFNYLQANAVWDKFKAINQNIRDELQRAQDASDKSDDEKENLLDCWDSFMSHKLHKLTEDGKNWVAKAIQDMKEYWVAENFDNDGFMEQVYKAVHEQLALLESKAIEGIEQASFDLGLGESMDTS